ncbi:Zinc finger BED domain-containing protein 1 [Merluccius polli]|uniref:Zinc finger BED domain-containing protein 1 n=1 Tax=Merluccius polli TaxID=89951 RepID=A0AA47N9Q5_MERPO|nr:Zinc finger BED domain-containing protein 1 [Merluccius polli]
MARNIEWGCGAANRPTRVSWVSVACFAHTLQLAINDGFALYLNREISAAGKLVGHFNHSTVASKALQKKQEQMGLASHRLIQSCKTRWNSVCEMFDRLVEQRWAVAAVLSDRTVTKLQDARILELKDEYWQLMEETQHVLRALKCATTVISAEKDVSISNECKLHLVQSAEFVSSAPMLSAMLDPRHKHLGFLTPAQRVVANMKLVELGEAVETGQEAIEQAGGHVDDGSANTGAAAATQASAMALLLEEQYSTQLDTGIDTEVNNFLRDTPPPLDCNPTDWWKVNGRRFPRLAKLARQYLCIPAT